jgi:hypothetical protein
MGDVIGHLPCKCIRSQPKNPPDDSRITFPEAHAALDAARAAAGDDLD